MFCTWGGWEGRDGRNDEGEWIYANIMNSSKLHLKANRMREVIDLWPNLIESIIYLQRDKSIVTNEKDQCIFFFFFHWGKIMKTWQK